MRLVFIILLCLLSLYTKAQEKENNIFFHPSGWQALLKKAKSEKKIIFVLVDSPSAKIAEKMEREVFPVDAVHKRLEENFIPTTISNDAASNSKSWYAPVFRSIQKYKLKHYPTALFFNENGELILYNYGYKDAGIFNNLLLLARDTQYLQARQSYFDYQNGIADYKKMGSAVYAANLLLAEKALVRTMISDYRDNYLSRLSGRELLTKNVLYFVQENELFYSFKPSDDFFQTVYNNQELVDSLLGSKISNEWIGGVISSQYLNALLYNNGKAISKSPDWEGIKQQTKSSFPKFTNTDQLITDTKISFYRNIKDWQTYTKLKSEQIAQSPPASLEQIFYQLNAPAWDVFLNSHDQEALQRALSWSELSIQLSQPEQTVQYWDTKANLLYKLGRKQDAIDTELTAIAVAEKYAPRDAHGNPFFIKEYLEMLDKMKAGKPTWNVQ